MGAHILPNILAEILVMGSLWLATAIRTEASLAFIGLGVKPPTADLGRHDPRRLREHPRRPGSRVFPSLAILIVVFALNLLGDGLRDAIDPEAAERGMTRCARRVLDVAGLTTEFRVDGVWAPVVSDLSLRRSAHARRSPSSANRAGKSVTALSIMRLLPAVGGRVAGAGRCSTAATCSHSPRTR